MSNLALSGTFDFWRKNLNTIPKRWGAVLKNHIPGFEHDVVFLVGENKKRISCHKFILSVSSPVFQAMFSENHGLNASIDSSTLQIEIPDIEYKAFQNLITYAYTATMDFAVQDALETMFAADKYDIAELTDYCSNLLNSNLSIENVVSIYQSAALLEDYKLRNNSRDFLISHFQEILNSSELLQMSSDTICKFIQLDEVNIASEVDLFNATIKWGKHNCELKELDATTENLRKILSDVITHVRFPLMNADDFAIHVEPTGILSENSCFVMYKYLSLSEKNRHLVGDCPYNTTLRKKLLTIVLWDNDIQSLSTIWLPTKPNVIDEPISSPIKIPGLTNEHSVESQPRSSPIKLASQSSTKPNVIDGPISSSIKVPSLTNEHSVESQPRSSPIKFTFSFGLPKSVEPHSSPIKFPALTKPSAEPFSIPVFSSVTKPSFGATSSPIKDSNPTKASAVDEVNLVPITVSSEENRKIRIVKRTKPNSPSLDRFNTAAGKGSYQESVLVTFTSGTTDSIALRSIGFVAPYGGNKITTIFCTLSDYSVNGPSEEATVEVTPIPGEVYYATFKNPIKLESGSTKIWNLFFDFLEGSPAILSDYGTVVKTVDNSQRLSVNHNGGQRIIAAMQFVTNNNL